MINPKTVFSVSISIVVVIIGIFVLVFGTFGQTTEGPGNQVGRYSIAVN